MSNKFATYKIYAQLARNAYKNRWKDKNGSFNHCFIDKHYFCNFN